MRLLKYLPALLFLVFSTDLLANSVIPKYDSYKHLTGHIDVQIQNSITMSDQLSIKISDVGIHKSFTKDQRIIEARVELIPLNPNPNANPVFTSIQRTALTKNPNHSNLSFNLSRNNPYILSSQKLANIKEVKVSIELRPIKDSQIELFEKLSDIIISNMGGNLLLDQIHSIFEMPEEDITPNFEATFRVPANSFQFQDMKNDSNRYYSVLTPNEKHTLIFSTEEDTLPEKLSW